MLLLLAISLSYCMKEIHQKIDMMLKQEGGQSFKLCQLYMYLLVIGLSVEIEVIALGGVAL